MSDPSYGLTEKIRDSILQIENAVSCSDCANLIEIYNDHSQRTDGRDYSGFPVVYWPLIRGAAQAHETLQRLIDFHRVKVFESHRCSETFYPEAVILAMLGMGGRHPLHADNARRNEVGDWVPNHTPNRAVASIFYLNDNFEGGWLVFPRQMIFIKPRRGLLVSFPCDQNFIHEVLPVAAGRRYTVTIWFTKQRAFALKDFS